MLILLSGTTLKSSVVNSSLTSVGTLSSLSTGDITLNGTAITSTAAELNILDGSGTSGLKVRHHGLT